MTDNTTTTETEATEADTSDPSWLEDESGEFWFELVIRNRAGTREARLTEVEGRVSGSPSAHLTAADLSLALVSTLKHLAEVIEGDG